MGQFMLLAERPIEDLRDEKFQSLLQGKPVDVGTEARLDDETLIAADMRGASCIAAEGELPFTAVTGWSITSVDFRSARGRCASLQRDQEGAHFYAGRSVTLAELPPTNLRPIEAWKLPSHGSSGGLLPRGCGPGTAHPGLTRGAPAPARP